MLATIFCKRKKNDYVCDCDKNDWVLSGDWNSFLSADRLFNEELNIIQSNLNNKKSIMKELKNILAQDAVLETVYHNFKVEYRESWFDSDIKIIRRRKKMLKKNLLEVAKTNLGHKEGCLNRYRVHLFSDRGSKSITCCGKYYEPSIKSWKRNLRRKRQQVRLCLSHLCCSSKADISIEGGWNYLMGFSYVDEELNTIHSNLNDRKAVITELKTLLAQDDILETLHQKFLAEHGPFDEVTIRDSLDNRRQTFARNLLANAKHNLISKEIHSDWYKEVDASYDMSLSDFKANFCVYGNDYYYTWYPFPKIGLCPPIGAYWKQYCCECCIIRRIPKDSGKSNSDSSSNSGSRSSSSNKIGEAPPTGAVERDVKT